MPVVFAGRVKRGSLFPKKIGAVEVTVRVYHGELHLGARNYITRTLVIPKTELDNLIVDPKTYFLRECDKVFCEIVDTLSAEGALEA